MIVNKRRLSEILGVTQRSLSDWMQKGMPVAFAARRGRSNQYDPAKVIEWRIERARAEMESLATRLKMRLAAAEIGEAEHAAVCEQENFSLHE